MGWAFPEGDLSSSSHSAAPLARPAAAAALREALRGVTHWLPEKALDHAATPTVDPAALAAGGPEPSLEEYRAMWPVVEGAPALRVLGPGFPRRPYQARAAGEMVADGVHWGQRKLFMNELELLTLHASPGDTVLYAGAAPGKHIEFLADRLFPELTFVLVDPAPFRIRPSARIRLVQGLMTDELAREYSSGSTSTGEPKRVIFVSDIRRTHASEDLILEDMLDQQRWHDILRPKVRYGAGKGGMGRQGSDSSRSRRASKRLIDSALPKHHPTAYRCRCSSSACRGARATRSTWTGRCGCSPTPSPAPPRRASS